VHNKNQQCQELEEMKHTTNWSNTKAWRGDVHNKEEKKAISKAKVKKKGKKEKWPNNGGILSKEQDDGNFLGFCHFGVNGKRY